MMVNNPYYIFNLTGVTITTLFALLGIITGLIIHESKINVHLEDVSLHVNRGQSMEPTKHGADTTGF